jgi:hypothetical protein
MDWMRAVGSKTEDEGNNLHTRNLRLPRGCLQVPEDYYGNRLMSGKAAAAVQCHRLNINVRGWMKAIIEALKMRASMNNYLIY